MPKKRSSTKTRRSAASDAKISLYGLLADAVDAASLLDVDGKERLALVRVLGALEEMCLHDDFRALIQPKGMGALARVYLKKAIPVREWGIAPKGSDASAVVEGVFVFAKQVLEHRGRLNARSLPGLKNGAFDPESFAFNALVRLALAGAHLSLGSPNIPLGASTNLVGGDGKFLNQVRRACARASNREDFSARTLTRAVLSGYGVPRKRIDSLTKHLPK